MLIILKAEKVIPYYVIFIIIYSAVSGLSIPPIPYTTSKAYATDDWNQEPNNTTHNITSETALPKTPRRYLRVVDQNSNGKKSELYSKNGVKRGLNIGLHLKFPTTQKYSNNLNKLEDMLEKALGLEGTLNSSSCPKCEEEDGVPVAPGIRRVKPAFQCDDWDAKLRLCILERNIGDTVTFYLSIGSHKGHRPNVTWEKEFHMQNTETRTGFVIDPGNTPQNIIIGKQGFELRVSPITEIDVGYNLFSATLSGHESKQTKVYFVIRIVPIDLGFVYVGESLELNLRSYVSLPAESLTFKWYMEKYGEHGTLPSNMRTSSAGSSIKISELRQEQEGILACSVYTNLEFLATKKRFLIKDLVKNKDVLESVPDHDLIFKEEKADRKKRYPKKLVRYRRAIDLDDIIEKVLESTTTESSTSKIPTIPHTYSNYDLEMDIGKGDPKINSFDNFDTSVDIENHEEFNEGAGGHSQPGKQFDVEEPEDHGSLQGNFEIQNGNGDISSQSEASVRNQIDRKSFKQHPSEGESSPAKDFPKLNGLPGNGHEAEAELKLPFPKESVNKYDIENEKGSYRARPGDAEIILNIDKIPGPRHISAEENIAKLISSCYSDFECSAAATCVRTNLKTKGFCKCLPGYYGVGIFCREDIWLSKSNFELDDIPDSSLPPAFQENM